MEALYNFHDLRELFKYEEFCERSNVAKFHTNCSISKTTLRLSLWKKLEIREYYATHKKYRETARVFGLQDSTVRKICKAAPPKKTNKGRFSGPKGSKHFKGNKSPYLIR